eukprot:gene10985-22949_t
MSQFKEFIPGKGLLTGNTRGYISSEDSGTSGMFSIAGVSQGRSIINNLPLAIDRKPIIESQMLVAAASRSFAMSSNNGLTPLAAEFVPTTTKTSTSANFNSSAGMNTYAAEWVPDASDTSVGTNTKVGEINLGEDGLPTEEMVEVNWNGSTFFVPESVAYAENAEAYQTIDEEGFEWTTGSTSIPAPPKRSLQTIGIPEPIRQHFQALDLESLRQLDPADERFKEIPPRYHSAFVLDDSSVQRGAGGSFGYPSSLYKVVDRVDSQTYALKRFDNVRTTSSVIKNSISRWSEMRHPSIVSLYSITQEKGAVFFAYAYHPAARTLRQRFIDQRGPLLSEALLWRIFIQLATGLRFVHSRGLAVRFLSPVHILLTSGTRVRFNYAGVSDVLEFESRRSLAEQQMEDLIRLGHVMLSLGTRSIVGAKVADQAMVLLRQHYSMDLMAGVSALLSGSTSITQLCRQISERVNDELDLSLAAVDALHAHLRSEYESSRMLRLLIKLGMINERPEYALAPDWSETGDRYVLKLFRDYVFHQAQTDGSPAIDVGHIITALNKLDAGDPERILLSSRDNKDVLLTVSFEDVKRCMEAAFVDLAQQAGQTQRSPMGHGGGDTALALHMSHTQNYGAPSPFSPDPRSSSPYVPDPAAMTMGGGGGGGGGMAHSTHSARHDMNSSLQESSDNYNHGMGMSNMSSMNNYSEDANFMVSGGRSGIRGGGGRSRGGGGGGGGGRVGRQARGFRENNFSPPPSYFGSSGYGLYMIPNQPVLVTEGK